MTNVCLIKTYIISDGKRVKIGKTINIERRLSHLQTGSSSKLKILLTINGDCERNLHRLFASDRKRGEWFKQSEAINAFVARLSGKKWRLPFRSWLLGQVEHDSWIGQLARTAAKDPLFPTVRSARLVVFLNHYSNCPELRESIRRAHRIWRQVGFRLYADKRAKESAS